MIFHAKNQQVSEETSGTFLSGKDILAVVKIDPLKGFDMILHSSHLWGFMG